MNSFLSCANSTKLKNVFALFSHFLQRIRKQITSRKSGNALRTFDCLKLYFIKQIRVCHVELTGTLIICRQSTTFHNNFLILFIQFPSTTYTRAYRRICYLNSGDSGIKFPFFKIPTLGKLLQTIKSRKIWL